MEFMYSQRGRQLLTYLGYKFYRVRRTTDGWKWRCTAKKCLANMYTDESASAILKGNTMHNHETDSKISRQMVSNNLKHRVKEGLKDKPVNLIKEELSALPQEHTMSIGAKDLGYIRKNLYRSRRRIKSKEFPDSELALDIKVEPNDDEQNDNDFETPSNPTKVGNRSSKTSRLEQPDHQEPEELGYLFPQIFEAGPSSSIVCCPDIILEDQNEHPQSEFESGMSENSSSTSQHRNSSIRPPCPPEVVQQERNSSSSVSRTQIFGWDPLTTFFLSMAQTVRTFPHPMQLDIKRKVFELVTEAESRIASRILDA